jgi:5-methylcytosine-specific restriction endonuclease McrA
MSHTSLMVQIARTDATFAQQGDTWVGRCLICGGPLRFEALTGAGATIEHILPRSLGGTNDLSNLGIAHRRCNGEKGRRWDPRRRHRARKEHYDELLHRLREERLRRWRETDSELTQ